MKQFLIFFAILGLLVACGRSGGGGSTYVTTEPCTVFTSESGQVLIKCPDGSEVDVTPIDGIDGIDGENCFVDETEDSYQIICADSEVEIPKVEDSDEEDSDDKSMRCKKKAHKKYKCNRERN